MRNLKKFLALVLATMMLLSVAVISTSAAKKDYDYSDAAERLAALQVMKGNENGDLMLDSEVTRYQAALFFVQALTGETETATWQTTKNSAYFSDVVDYGTAIDYAYGINIVKGRGNGIYGYNDAIMYQDMLVMAVRALGYETADMSYPYGYILAAQKLGLTENVEKTDYKAALTRGETAQIIWDMLDTKVAVIDPITDKLLYPNETGLTDALVTAAGVEVDERLTLMEESELVIDKVISYVTEFVEAEDDDEVDVVVVESEFGSVEVAAADYGITAETPAVSYLGLPVETYLDVKADEFDQNEYDRDDAHILFTVFPTYESVLNLGDGNVKVTVNEKDADRTALVLNGEKFTAGNYQFTYAYFGENGWTWSGLQKLDVDHPFYAFFEYDDGEYVNDLHTYWQVSYLETDYYAYDEENEEYDVVVEMLITPLTFGQYNVRELKDRANSSKLTDFATLAYYTADAYTNYDDETSNFQEVLVGSWDLDESITDGSKVTGSTTSVSSKNGANAKDLTLAGEEVKAGDFIFYAYNGMDNILTVAKNCGTFETGRLTAKNTSNETVKIGGTNYEFGFAGPVATNGMPSDWDSYAADLQDDYIEELAPGKDNVKYLVIDDKIVYMEPCVAEHNDSLYDFVVISRDAERVADVLGVSDEKYAKNLSGVTDAEAGVYVADNGYVAVAVLSKTTGEWELGYIKAVVDEYDYYDDEFDTSYDVATLASYTDMFNTPSEYAKYANYVAADAILSSAGTDMVLAAVEVEDNNVYTVANPNYSYDLMNDDDEYIDEDGEVVEEAAKVTVDGCFFVSGDYTDGYFAPENATVACEGIIFSDNNTKTNAITCDNDVDAERVVVDDETVIIVYDNENGVAGARVGVQGADNSYAAATGSFLAASADLIVLVDWNGAMVETEDGEVPYVTVWADELVSSKDETWYVITADTAVELENASENEDEELYIVTITNLFDMKTLEIVESIEVEVEEPNDDLVYVGEDYTFIHKKGELVEVEKTMTFSEIIVKVANANDNKIKYVEAVEEDIVFTDADTIEVAEVENAGYAVDYKKTGEAVEVVANVVTLNLVAKQSKYDFDKTVMAEDYVYDNGTEDSRDIWNIGSADIVYGFDDNGEELEYTVWDYILDGDMVEEINEPTDGILDSYILAMDGAVIFVPRVDNDDYADGIACAVELESAVAYEDGVVYLTVYKVIYEVEIGQ